MSKKRDRKIRDLRAIIFIVAGIFLLGVLFTTFTLVRHTADNKRFDTLSSIMQSLNSSLRARDANNQIKYSETCEDLYESAFASGEIACGITITFERLSSDQKDLARLHSLYYTAVLADTELLPSSQLDILPPATFGKSFVVSSAEQRFTLPKVKGIKCSYLIRLVQTNETSRNFGLGTPIDGEGKVRFDFECIDRAKDYWFERV